MSLQNTSDAAIETLKIAPPAAVSVYTLAGLTPEQWVTTLTILYLLALLAEKVWRWISAWRTRP